MHIHTYMHVYIYIYLYALRMYIYIYLSYINIIYVYIHIPILTVREAATALDVALDLQGQAAPAGAPEEAVQQPEARGPRREGRAFKDLEACT